MDILTDVLNRVRLNGTLLFRYELGHPWRLALPQFPDAVFHYLCKGSASVALEKGRTVRMAAGDFVLVARGEPMWSGRVAGRKPSHYLISISGLRIWGSFVTAVRKNRFRR
jgi:hypothetical protein